MKIDKTIIQKVVRLANLPLDETQITTLISQFQQTLDSVNILNEIDTGKVQPSYSASEKQNVWREDGIFSSLPRDEALKNAKRTYIGYFVCDPIKKAK